MSASAPARTLVHIGGVTLHGFTRREGARFGTAFEGELGRLLSTLPAGVRSLRADTLVLEPLRRRAGERPEATGRRVAQLIVRSLLP